jgi:hypothetical protein
MEAKVCLRDLFASTVDDIDEERLMRGRQRDKQSLGRRHRVARVAPGVLAAALAVVAPAAANAADYCVSPNTTCGGTNVATLEQALDLADNATDADRVFLGAGTYTSPGPSGYTYNQPGSPVEIIGQGQGKTILTGPAGSFRVLWLDGGATSSVHDLTLKIPQNMPVGDWGLALGSTARRVDVVEDPVQSYPHTGVSLLDGGVLEDSTVTLADTMKASTTAVSISGGNGTIRHSTMTAWWDVDSPHGGTIERSTLVAGGAGVGANAGLTTIDTSLIRMTLGDSVAIYAGPNPGADVTVNADSDTIIGPGQPDSEAVDDFTNFAPTQNVDLNIRNSVFRGVTRAANAVATGSGHAKINISYSDYDPAGNLAQGANASVTQTNVSNVGDAGFVNAAGGDYHLRAGSPLIDTGDPATPQGSDLDGNPLVTDGNGDRTARRDKGAFEAPTVPPSGGQPGGGGTDSQPPVISSFRATPAVFRIARAGTAVAARSHAGTQFRYTLSEAARVTLTIRQALPGRRHAGRCVRATSALRHAARCTRYRTVGTLRRTGKRGANAVAFTGRIGRRALVAGSYQAVISATDAAKNKSKPRSARFRIAAR